jgi:hypothetical protein
VESINRLTELLSRRGVDWTSEHKNVTYRCIGINCPYCANDESYHLGIFKAKPHRWSCWRCGRTGTLAQLVFRLFGMRKDELRSVLECGDIDDLPAIERIRTALYGQTAVPTTEQDEPVALELPDSTPITANYCPKIVQRFLRRRNFSVKHCMYYDARYAGEDAGRWSGYLILPVYLDGQLISCTGRLMYSGEPKYMNVGDQSIKSLGAFYGDAFWRGGRLIVVEGQLDVWRLGDMAIGTFGCTLTSEQESRIHDMYPSEIIMAWDSDAYLASFQTAQRLSGWCKSVKVLRLPTGHDPDTLGAVALEELIIATAPL